MRSATFATVGLFIFGASVIGYSLIGAIPVLLDQDDDPLPYGEVTLLLALALGLSVLAAAVGLAQWERGVPSPLPARALAAASIFTAANIALTLLIVANLPPDTGLSWPSMIAWDALVAFGFALAASGLRPDATGRAPHAARAQAGAYVAIGGLLVSAVLLAVWFNGQGPADDGGFGMYVSLPHLLGLAFFAVGARAFDAPPVTATAEPVPLAKL